MFLEQKHLDLILDILFSQICNDNLILYTMTRMSSVKVLFKNIFRHTFALRNKTIIQSNSRNDFDIIATIIRHVLG